MTNTMSTRPTTTGEQRIMKTDRSRMWRPFFVAWVILAVLSGAWSMSTPIGGSPDEPAHLVRAAAVATGQLTPFEHKGMTVRVPAWIANAQDVTCYAHSSSATPSCVPPERGNQARTVSITATAGRYNPLYYALVGWPSLFMHSSAGTYVMRLVSDVLVSFFLALSIGMLAVWRRRTLPLIGLLAAATPMVFFLGGVVNPNSLEITATLAAFVGVLSVLRDPRPDQLALRAGIVFLAASVAANMRGLSLLWIAVAILAPFILATREQIGTLLRSRAVRLAILGCFITFVAALAWMVIANPLTVGDSSAAAGGAKVGTSHLAGFAFVLFSTFDYSQQLIGVFGWVAFGSPAAVYAIWWFFIIGLFVVATAVARRRELVFVGTLIAALLLLPAITQGVFITNGGLIWQARYILPVFLCTMVGAAAILPDIRGRHPAVARRLLYLFVGAWSIGQFLAFATALKHYAVSDTRNWTDILSPAWAPPGGVLLWMAVFAITAIAGAVIFALWQRRDLGEATPTTEDETRVPSREQSLGPAQHAP